MEYSSNNLRTEDIVGDTENNNKYTIVSSGYTNFEKEAVLTPIEDYIISELENNGTTVDRNNLVINYTNIDQGTVQEFLSDDLKTNIMEPIDKELNKDNNNFIGANVNLKVAGVTIFRRKATSFDIQKVNMIDTLIKPLLRLWTQ